MILDKFSFVKINELDFLKAFKNENLESLFEPPFVNNFSFVLLDDKELFYAIVDFNPFDNIFLCSFYSSKDVRIHKNEFNIEAIPYTSDLNLLHFEVDHFIEEEEKLLTKKDFINKKNKIKNKSLRTEHIPKHLTDIHSKSQFFLKSIGDIIEITTWIAKNDKSRGVFGNELGINTLKDFPKLDCEKDTLETIKLIDVIWFNGFLPYKCFEVETSTSIYSGILRFYDLQLTCPDLPIDFYIIIPKKE